MSLHESPKLALDSHTAPSLHSPSCSQTIAQPSDAIELIEQDDSRPATAVTALLGDTILTREDIVAREPSTVAMETGEGEADALLRHSGCDGGAWEVRLDIRISAFRFEERLDCL